MPFAPRFAKAPPALPAMTGDGIASAAPRTLLARFHTFSHGRTALRLALVHLGFRAGDRILVPDFVCDALVLPLEDIGLVPVYYPVDRSLRADWTALDRIAAGARAMVMIHYFGRPQQIDAYRRFCGERGLLLIEDNAHGFGGYEGSDPLGTIGDIAISSPWKNFAIRNGGLLHMKGPGDPRWRDLSDEPPRCFPMRRTWLNRYAAGWRHENRRFGHRLQAVPATAPIAERRMAPDALATLASADIEAATRRRREIYRVWDRWARDAGLEPVFADPPGRDAPLVHPAWCHSPQHRHTLLDWCWRQGIDAYTWPKLPPEVLASGGQPLSMWGHLVCLPIHQAMDPGGLAAFLAERPPPPG